jgi:hypothetical protein
VFRLLVLGKGKYRTPREYDNEGGHGPGRGRVYSTVLSILRRVSQARYYLAAITRTVPHSPGRDHVTGRAFSDSDPVQVSPVSRVSPVSSSKYHRGREDPNGERFEKAPNVACARGRSTPSAQSAACADDDSSVLV